MPNTRKYANGPTTSLNGAILAAAGTLVVHSSSGFPSAGDFTIRIDNEFLLVTAVSGTTWTVSRGQESSTGADHLDAASVSMPLTADALAALIVESVNGTVAASRRQINFVDSASVTWTLTDDATNKKMDVSAAATGGGGGGGGGYFETLTAPPAVSSFTWVNQSTATAVDDASGLYLLAPPVSGNNGRMLVQSATAPYTLTVKIHATVYLGDSHVSGICVRDSGTGKFIRFGWNDIFILLDKFNSPTSFNSQYAAFKPAPPGIFTWLQVQDDNTNLIFRFSNDGLNWVTMETVSRTDFLATPNQYGVYAESANTSRAAATKLLSWAVT